MINKIIKNSKRGFTIMEMVVVIAILGVLMATIAYYGGISVASTRISTITAFEQTFASDMEAQYEEYGPLVIDDDIIATFDESADALREYIYTFVYANMVPYLHTDINLGYDDFTADKLSSVMDLSDGDVLSYVDSTSSPFIASGRYVYLGDGIIIVCTSQFSVAGTKTTVSESDIFDVGIIGFVVITSSLDPYGNPYTVYYETSSDSAGDFVIASIGPDNYKSAYINDQIGDDIMLSAVFKR